jgi:hypothetical protein
MLRKFTVSILFLSLLLTSGFSFSQELDTLHNPNLDSLQNIKLDSLHFKTYVVQSDSDVVAVVNRNALLIDMIHSNGEIAVKTSSIDESGSIEIKVKRKDDVWYKISGSIAVFSKDAFWGHFNRKNFIYVNNLNETVIEGKTNDTNIGYITRIRCSFDDIQNVMSGTCYICVTEKDIVVSENDPTFYLITIKSENKSKKYWIRKDDYTVTKYVQYDDKNDIYLTVEYSNFYKTSNSAYAKRIVIQRPAKREKLSLFLTEVSLNQNNLIFTVDVPSDFRKIKWLK